MGLQVQSIGAPSPITTPPKFKFSDRKVLTLDNNFQINNGILALNPGSAALFNGIDKVMIDQFNSANKGYFIFRINWQMYISSLSGGDAERFRIRVLYYNFSGSQFTEVFYDFNKPAVLDECQLNDFTLQSAVIPIMYNVSGSIWRRAYTVDFNPSSPAGFYNCGTPWVQKYDISVNII